MILYYVDLPGGERLFVDPIEEKLTVVKEFKDSFSFDNPGTNQEWLDNFLEEQDDFLNWAKEKTADFPYESGECGCYSFDDYDFHLIKDTFTVQGDHHSCIVFNNKELSGPINGIGTMEEWDEDGKLTVRRTGFIINGKLQGWGEKIDFDTESQMADIYRGEFIGDQLNGEGRLMTGYWMPKKDEKQLYYFSNWVEFCMDPNTTYYQIMDPLKGDELSFSIIQIGTFKNDKLNGDGFYYWGSPDDEYEIFIGLFVDDKLNGLGLNISASFFRSDAQIYIKEGNFVKNELCGKGCFAMIEPDEDNFNLDDLFPFMRREESIRECMLNNEHFVPKNYKEGNLINNELIGHGIEVNYKQSYIRSGPALETNTYEGDFLYDMQHGYGVYDGENLKYKGYFFGDRFHGFGRQIIHYAISDEKGFRPEKSLYTGEFVCDLFHGIGQRVLFFGDGSAKVYEGNFVAGRLEDGSHMVKIYRGFNKEEISAILESEDTDPITLPEEKFIESLQVQYLHGEEVKE